MTTLQLPKLEKWQLDVAKDLVNIRGSGKIFSIVAVRQCGKSVLMAEALIHFAGNNSNTISILVEPTFPQCKNIFSTIKKWIQDTPIIESINNSEMSLTLINKSKIICKSAAQKDSLRGFTADFLAVDEACFISSDVWPLILPWTNAKNAPILMVSTPLFPEGSFYNFWSNPDGEKYFSYDWSTYDTSKYLSPERLEYFRKTMPKWQFEAEFEAKWVTNGAYTFTNYNNCIYKEKPKDPPIYAGIDFGVGNDGDYTVVALINKNHEVNDVIYFNNIDPHNQIIKLASIINDNPTLKSVLAEQNSIGNVYISELKQRLKLKHILHSFNTTNDSKRKIIEDLCSDFIQENIKIPDDSEVISQISHYATEKTPSGKITYNAVNPYHDDIVMALAICNSHFHNKNGQYNIKFIK